MVSPSATPTTRPVMVSALAVQASASSMAVITCRSAYICDDQRFLQDATVCRYQLSIPSASFWSLAICASFFLRKVSASFSSRTIEAGALVGITGRVAATGAGFPGGFVTRNGTAGTGSTGLMPWASRMGTWQTNHHPTTPKISVPFGECLVVVEAPAGVGLRYLAGRHPACAQWGKNSWRVSLPPKGKHVF